MYIKKIFLIIFTSLLLSFKVQAAESSKVMSGHLQTNQSTVEDKNLKNFNQNVGISLIQRGIDTQNEESGIVLIYEVQNKGKSRIKNVHWSSAFIANNQIFYIQEIKTSLDKAIMPNTKESITVVLPLNSLPDNVKSIFTKNDISIGHLTIAKQLDFTNGKKIVVKE